MDISENRCGSPLFVRSVTAGDLMKPNVISIGAAANLQEAVTLLIEKNLGAVPVLGEEGRPIGVLSRSDVVTHDARRHEYSQPAWYATNKEYAPLQILEGNYLSVSADPALPVLVRDIMTPVVFSVARDTPANLVVDALLSMGIHRIFVTDEAGEVIGVISTTDVLRYLRRQSLGANLGEEEGLCLGA